MMHLIQRKHRHTRPSKFVSRACRAEQLHAVRQGMGDFSFSGDMPVMDEAALGDVVYRGTGSREYTRPNPMGVTMYQDQPHVPVVSRQGVRRSAALVMLAALVLALGSVYLSMHARCDAASNAIGVSRTAAEQLRVQCSVLEGDIAALEGDLNLRLLAGQMGLVSCRGVQVNYLPEPQNAVITPADAQSILSLASIWGN